MKNAIAIWNYTWDAGELPAAIHEFADHGFDAISFHPRQFAGSLAQHLPAVVEVLRVRGLAATVHGSCVADRESLVSAVTAMRDHLYAVTLDSAMREDSRGRLHDAGRIAESLAFLQSLTAGTAIWLAIEDFPLDALALKHFATDLGRVYDHPRTGILIDVGHMNLRMKNSNYFSGLSVGEYFRALPCRLVEVHLHDNNGEKDQHGHFGFGNVPLAEVARSLKAIAFDGVCTIEIAPGFHGSTPPESKGKAVQSLELWRQWIHARQ